MNKTKSIKKTTICLLMAVIMVLSCGVTAFANIYSDWTTTGTINGYKYKYRAEAIFGSNYVYGVTRVQTTNGAKAPGGYMGVKSYLFTSSGDLVKFAGINYNSVALSSYYITTDNSYSSGTYYSQGLVYLYNGSGYSVYNTNATLYGTLSTSVTGGEYQVNSNNETYGSGLLYDVYGEFPDLIKAEGENGVVGYVRNDELNDDESIKTPEEALAYSEANADGRYIPVYDLDGNVVDTFYVGGADTDEAQPGNMND